jgi:hypothetical protein
MKAARCALALCGGKPNDLAAGTASHRLNFLAARLNGTENPPKRPGVQRMSVDTTSPAIWLPAQSATVRILLRRPPPGSKVAQKFSGIWRVSA